MPGKEVRVTKRNLFLGIDVGTTKTAAVVIGRDGRLFASFSRPHGADIPASRGYAEQDANILLRSAWDEIGRASCRERVYI